MNNLVTTASIKEGIYYLALYGTFILPSIWYFLKYSLLEKELEDYGHVFSGLSQFQKDVLLALTPKRRQYFLTKGTVIGVTLPTVLAAIIYFSNSWLTSYTFENLKSQYESNFSAERLMTITLDSDQPLKTPLFIDKRTTFFEEFANKQWATSSLLRPMYIFLANLVPKEIPNKNPITILNGTDREGTVVKVQVPTDLITEYVQTVSMGPVRVRYAKSPQENPFYKVKHDELQVISIPAFEQTRKFFHNYNAVSNKNNLQNILFLMLLVFPLSILGFSLAGLIKADQRHEELCHLLYSYFFSRPAPVVEKFWQGLPLAHLEPNPNQTITGFHSFYLFLLGPHMHMARLIKSQSQTQGGVLEAVHLDYELYLKMTQGIHQGIAQVSPPHQTSTSIHKGRLLHYHLEHTLLGGHGAIFIGESLYEKVMRIQKAKPNQ